MAASARTLASASAIASFFGSEPFTAAEYNAYQATMPDFVNFVTLSTLTHHGLVRAAEPAREVDGVFSPAEFADYVSEELVGEDCYGWDCRYEWDAVRGVFEEVHYVARYAVCA